MAAAVSCKKKRYRTAEQARKAARNLFWSTHVTAASIYWCQGCGAMHVTKKPAKRGAWRRF